MRVIAGVTRIAWPVVCDRIGPEPQTPAPVTTKSHFHEPQESYMTDQDTNQAVQKGMVAVARDLKLLLAKGKDWSRFDIQAGRVSGVRLPPKLRSRLDAYRRRKGGLTVRDAIIDLVYRGLLVDEYVENFEKHVKPLNNDSSH